MIQVLGIGIIAAILFLVQKHIYKKLWNKNLKVELSFTTSELYEGESGSLKEIITNGKRLPLPMLMVKFNASRNLVFEDGDSSQTTDQYYRNEVFQINGREKITRTLPFVGDKRGYYQITSVDLVTSDLFMSTKMYSSQKVNEDIYVYARPFYNDVFRGCLQQLNGEILSKRHLIEDPFEYRGIREYQTFDDMKNINWKSTAKTGELKVNLKNYTALKVVRIFINLEYKALYKKSESIEVCIQMVAGLAKFFLGQGMMISCYGNGVDVLTNQHLTLEASAGTGQLRNLYRLLARIDAEKPVVSFVDYFGDTLLANAGQTMTCVVSPSHRDDFVGLLEQYKASGNDFIWFYPVCDSQEPSLPETLVKNIKVIHIEQQA